MLVFDDREFFLQISALDLLNSDPTYQGLRELAADNNQITSILPLEGSRFINNFLALSLRNNKIKSVSFNGENNRIV